MYYALISFGDFAFQDIVLYMIFLFISVFAYTTLMDGHKLAIPMELAKLIMGLFLINKMGGWYELDTVFASSTYAMIAYLGVSFLVTLYFSYFENRVPDREIAL